MTPEQIISRLLLLAEEIGEEDLEDAEAPVIIPILVLVTLASALDSEHLIDFGKCVLEFSDKHNLGDDPDRN